MESQSLTDEIKGLKLDLEVRKGKRDKLEVSDPLYTQRDLHVAFAEEITSIRNQIDTKEKRLLFLTEQHGKFASPISIVLSHSYR